MKRIVCFYDSFRVFADIVFCFFFVEGRVLGSCRYYFCCFRAGKFCMSRAVQGKKNLLYFHRRVVWKKACHMSRSLLTNHMRCFCWCGTCDRSITLQHPLLKQRTKPWRPSPCPFYLTPSQFPRYAVGRNMSRILSASHLPVS